MTLVRVERVFVYGPLQRGFWNDYLLSKSKGLGPARTREHYALYVSLLPYVRRDEALYPIDGAIYEVSLETLQDLDLLAGHPHWYIREEVTVVLEDGTELPAWVYFHDGNLGTLQSSGRFEPRRCLRAESCGGN